MTMSVYLINKYPVTGKEMVVKREDGFEQVLEPKILTEVTLWKDGSLNVFERDIVTQ